jgi:hypothetical protein
LLIVCLAKTVQTIAGRYATYAHAEAEADGEAKATTTDPAALVCATAPELTTLPALPALVVLVAA